MKTLNHLKNSWKTIFFLCLFACFGLSKSFACTTPPPQPPPIIIIKIGPYLYIIIVKNYTTFGSPAGANCACGLDIPASLGTVTSAELREAGTENVVSGFNFSPNATTSSGLASIQPGDWNGLVAGIPNAVAAGAPVDLAYTVELDSSKTKADLQAYLNAQNNSGVQVFVTGEAQSDGTPINDSHLAFLGFNEIMVPSLSQWALILLSLGLLSLALVGIKQPQQRLAMAGGAALPQPKTKLFDKEAYGKMLLKMSPLFVLGFPALYFIFGEITIADFFGWPAAFGGIVYIATLIFNKK